MKILHLNFYNNIGGAGIAANRLHNQFLRNGLESKIIVFKSNDKNDFIINIDSRLNKILHKIFIRLDSLLLKIYKPYVGAFSLNIFGVLNIKKIIKEDPSIIYIHWINNSFISLGILKKIFELNIPVFIFLHDMWFLTGGCHHSFDCNKYIEQCQNCKNLNSNFKYDVSYFMFKWKKHIFLNSNNYKVIAPSSWMAFCAKQSTFFNNKEIVRIPNFVDTNIFYKIDKTLTRKNLNLNNNSKIILYGADMANTNPYKGWLYLKKALVSLECDYHLVTFGSNIFDTIIDGKKIEITNFGRIQDQNILRLLYNAADVFVIPSLAEAFGQTAIESMSCGTPVVAFNVGGLKDIIEHKSNGYIAKYKDASDLANGIHWILNQKNSNFSSNCIQFINNKFSSQIVIDQHKSLIKNSLNNN